MDFGVRLAISGERASPNTYSNIAAAADDSGFSSIWIGDHVAFPDEISKTYPFSPDGSPPPRVNSSQDVYDAFTVLSYLAGRTDNVFLGTNVCVVPYRHPVALLKSVFSLNALSGGRFEFGIGTGWLRTEFELLDVPYDERGSRTDEFLDLFNRAIVDEEFEYNGTHHSFSKAGFHPVPADPPRIWIGGRSGATFRRVAQYGDGCALGWDRPKKAKAARDRILAAWRDFDRQGEPAIAVGRPIHVGTDAEVDTDRPLVGSPRSVRADVQAYDTAGVSHLIVSFFERDLEDQLEQLRRFDRGVIEPLA